MKKKVSILLVLCLTLSLFTSFLTWAEVPDAHTTHQGEEGWTAVSNYEELDAMKPEQKYYLTADIVVPADQTKTAILEGGTYIFDGCGYSITVSAGTVINAKIFLFANLQEGSEISNLTVGSSENPLNMVVNEGNHANVGVIAGQISGDTVVSNVHIWASIDDSLRTTNNNVGGVAGKFTAGSLTITDSSFHGSYRSTASHQDKYFGGMVGNLSGGTLKIVDCTADFTVETGDGSFGGMLGGATAGNYFQIIGCKNIGDIGAVHGDVGGMVGRSKVDFILASAILGCVNEGKLTADESTATAGEMAGNFTVVPQKLLIAACTGVQNGKLVGASASEIRTELLEMVTGAAVRTNEPAGLRFRTRIELADYQMLVDLFGAEQVEFGTLIAPTAYVQEAGAFTREALDALAKDSETYLDIPFESVQTGATDDEKWNRVEGTLASFTGSVANLMEDHYELAYSGIGYITVTVEGTQYTIYAPYDTENSRCVKDVATAALAQHEADPTVDNYSDAEVAVLKKFAGQN